MQRMSRNPKVIMLISIGSSCFVVTKAPAVKLKQIVNVINITLKKSRIFFIIYILVNERVIKNIVLRAYIPSPCQFNSYSLVWILIPLDLKLRFSS